MTADSNMPILWRNVMLGLTSEIGRKAFVWAAETRDSTVQKYPAETYAHEVETICGFLGNALGFVRKLHAIDDERLDDLQMFMLKRHANHRFGGNVNMWWEAA